MPFNFASESAVFNPASGAVQFRLEFNQTPDFITVDALGRQANSFQYFIVGDPALPYPGNFDAIIRGEEIHITMDVVLIRNSTPADPDPTTGGWGAIRGSVPFSVDGNVMTFETPLSLVNDHSLDGNFAYRLESYVFGSTTNIVENRASVVPEPTTLLLFVTTAAGIGLARWRQQRRKQEEP